MKAQFCLNSVLLGWNRVICGGGALQVEKLFLARRREEKMDTNRELFHFIFVNMFPPVMFMTFLASFYGLTLLASTIRGVVAPTDQRFTSVPV